jgi:hypothetical protein
MVLHFFEGYEQVLRNLDWLRPIRRSRAVSKREKGTWQHGAMRNRFGLSQVVRIGFGSGRIAVTQRVKVATVNQHGQVALAVPERGSAK